MGEFSRWELSGGIVLESMMEKSHKSPGLEVFAKLTSTELATCTWWTKMEEILLGSQPVWKKSTIFFCVTL